MGFARSSMGSLVVVCLAALAAADSPALAENRFPEVFRNWSSPALQASRAVAGLTLTAGHARLVVAHGSAAKVVVGGEVVGIFVAGEGTIEYLSADPVEAPPLAYNVGKNTSLKGPPDSKGTLLRSRFADVLWLAGSAALPDLPAQGEGASLDKSFAANLRSFARLQSTSVAHQFAAWQLNHPDRPLVRAQLTGGDEDLLYVFDAGDERSEALHLVRKSISNDRALSDRLYLTTLSDQPVGRERRDPLVPRFLLSDVDLAVTASDGKEVSIVATETFQAVGGTSRVLLLDLLGTRFAYNNLGALDPRTLRVKSVTDAAGAPVPFDHAKDELAVGLNEPLAPGKPATLRFELEGDLLFRPGGDNYWELGVEPWFPQPDLAGQYYKVHAVVKVKKPFVPFAPGKTVRREAEGDYNVLETRIDKPVQFMVVLAGKYYYEEAVQGATTIRVASYGGKDTVGIRKLLKLAGKVIDYYDGFLGPFPFEELNVVEIHDWGFGQAPPGFMFITSEVFNPIGGQVNRFFSGGANERFAHEIAHQYWGHVVKMPSYEEQWLTESFAEICAGLFVRDLRGKDDFKRLVADWRNGAKDSASAAPIPLANRLFAKSDARMASLHRTNLLYSKGPLLLDAVREEIGDRPFLVFLNSLQATFKWKFGSTKGAQAVLEAVTKKEWKGFFDSYYWGTAIPGK